MTLKKRTDMISAIEAHDVGCLEGKKGTAFYKLERLAYGNF
jgi:hypothetical protein